MLNRRSSLLFVAVRSSFAGTTNQHLCNSTTTTTSSLPSSIIDCITKRHPFVHSAGRQPSVLYCHGLGGSWNLALPLAMRDHVTDRRGHGYTRFQYRHVQDVSRVWNVNSWLEDILHLLDVMYEQVGAQILVASSAGAHSALRAAIERPDKVHSLLLAAPGVGLQLDYMDRLVPGSVRLLKQGKRVLHPAMKGGYDACVDLHCLTDYVRLCVSNSMSTIPGIKCPVKIVHGKKDTLVPYANSIKLQSQLTDCELVLIDDVGHSIGMCPQLVHMLDQLLAHVPAEQPTASHQLAWMAAAAESINVNLELKQLHAASGN